MTQYQGYSRDPLSLMNPVIGFKFSGTGQMYNYAYSPDLGGRYYFIEDWTYIEGIWYATMRCDVLATYKTAIGNSTEYISRCADRRDGYIVDTYYPTKQGVTRYTSEFETADHNDPWPQITNPLTGGWYVVGIVNHDGASIGGASYYCLDNTNFRTLMMALLSNPNWTNMDFTSGEISEELYKSLFNPMQYITSCIWTPVTPSMGVAVGTFSLGWWTIPGVVAYPLSATINVVTCAASLTKHPQAATRGAYLNAAPYTRLKITQGPFGDIPLDTTMYVDSSNVMAVYTFDNITGAGMCEVGPDYNIGFARHIDKVVTAQFGVPIQISQVAQYYAGKENIGVGLAAQFMGSGGNVLDFLQSKFNNAMDRILGKEPSNPGLSTAATSMLPQVQTTGMNGSFAGFRLPPRLQIECWNVVAEDVADRGCPYCVREKINLHSGYILVLDPQIATSGTATETARVRAYMAAGFFYE